MPPNSSPQTYCWDRKTFRAYAPYSLPYNFKTHNPMSSDLVKFLTEEPNAPEAHALFSRALTARDSTAGFNFETLRSTIRPESKMTIQLFRAPVEAGKYYTVFEAYNNSWEEQYMMDVYGDAPPTDAIVLEFLRRAMVKPSAPRLPEIPARIVFTPEFALYNAVIQPFLHALPGPITVAWIRYVVDEDEHEDPTVPLPYDAACERAEALQQRGNAAFAAFQGDRALKAYGSAFRWLGRAVSRAPGLAEDKRATARMAVMLANRAAMRLRDPNASEAELRDALQDGEGAEGMDPVYAKGYHRQARAWVLLGDAGKARQVLERGLANVAPCDMQLIREALAGLPA
ncbi:hypothetical protein FA95DRAFT_348922 [Auriscalpium vulgare]|uniref:Uncharacterized protein n=1 Tax=Auriscalpium vulgare TaxID=40419 RepID=A0ACB8RI77_9AGAM|nr:hypothetical protein FA95DRAFT_348922 [Auriscalpium vulgare]